MGWATSSTEYASRSATRSGSTWLAAVSDGWPLTAARRARLAPAAELALSIGWTPTALAAFTGANTSGVRSAYAVLAARLSPAELPRPPGRPVRRPWCGEFDQVT